MITLAHETTTVALPADLFWTDEFTERPVVQSATPTITGAVIVQTAARTQGRPITLQSGANYAWLTRTQLDTLNAWADVPGRVMTLNIRGVPRDVVFRHHAGPAIEAEMVLYHAQPAATDYYRCTIRLMQV